MRKRDISRLRRSALVAYREDLPDGDWDPPSSYVAGCLTVASVLESATELSSPARRLRMLSRAAEMSAELLGPEAVALGLRIESGGLQTAAAHVRGLVERLEIEDGYHHSLGAHLLESLTQLVPSESVEGGRGLAHLVRTTFFLGSTELAYARTVELLRLAHRLESDELRLRAWLFGGGIAHERGNFPRAARARSRAHAYALRTNEPRMIASTLTQIATTQGMNGQYDLAVGNCWQALQMADHPTLRAILLQNLGETMYRTGHFEASRAARALSLKLRGSMETVLICLGGYAASCAALGDIDGVAWAASEALALTRSRRPARGHAQGLLGCADGCAEVGLDDLARTLYQRGHEIAEAKGYHDLRFRPDLTASTASQRVAEPFIGVAEEARKTIVQMAPRGVDADFTLAGV